MKPGPIQAWANKQPSPNWKERESGKEISILSNALAFKMFAAVDKPGENVLISPISMMLTLAMMANGAGAETQKAICDAIGDEGGLKPLNEGMQNLMITIHQGNDCPITLSNSVWTMKDYPPTSTFVDAMQKNYDAKVSTSLSAEAINKWTAEATGELIDHVLDQIDPNTQHIVIANAAAFRARWQTEFDPSKTKDGTFHVTSSKGSDAHFMVQTEQDYASTHSNFAQWLLMPYKNPDFLMVMILPDRDSPEVYLSKQTWETWGNALGDMTTAKTPIQIPRMKIAAQYDMLNALPKLGLGELLHHADMSSLSSGLHDDFVNVAMQSTFIDVDEQGTKAAASTEMGTAGGTGGEGFIANRPFAFGIVYRPTSAILFLGVCNDPSE